MTRKELNTIWRRASRKSPCDKAAGAASLVVSRSGGGSAADIAADDLAEQIPLLAVELHQLKLRDRGEVSSTGINLDARHQAAPFKSLDPGGLLHDFLPPDLVSPT